MLNDSRYRNLIVLKSVYGKVEMKYFLSPTKDPRTGRYPDCVKPVDSKGDLILSEADKSSGEVWIGENQVIEVMDGTTFDLNDKYDRAKWEAIKYSPVIAPSRTAKDSTGKYMIDGDTSRKGTYETVYSARFGVAELYIEKPGEDVQVKVSKKKQQHRAISFIVDDPKGASNRLLMAKLLGRNMKHAHDADVEDYLISIAEKDPEVIINLYTEEDTALRLLFVDAKEKGVIYIKNKLYLFGEGTVLGATDNAVIAWMRDPKNIRVLELIRKETNPELYAEPEPNYQARIQEPQPITYNSGTGVQEPVELPQTDNKVVEIPATESKSKGKK